MLMLCNTHCNSAFFFLPRSAQKYRFPAEWKVSLKGCCRRNACGCRMWSFQELVWFYMDKTFQTLSTDNLYLKVRVWCLWTLAHKKDSKLVRPKGSLKDPFLRIKMWSNSWCLEFPVIRVFRDTVDSQTWHAGITGNLAPSFGRRWHLKLRNHGVLCWRVFSYSFSTAGHRRPAVSTHAFNVASLQKKHQKPLPTEFRFYFLLYDFTNYWQWEKKNYKSFWGKIAPVYSSKPSWWNASIPSCKSVLTTTLNSKAGTQLDVMTAIIHWELIVYNNTLDTTLHTDQSHYFFVLNAPPSFDIHWIWSLQQKHVQ